MLDEKSAVTMGVGGTNITGWQAIDKYLDDQATRLTERDVVIVQSTNSTYTEKDKKHLTMLVIKCNNSGAQFCRYSWLEGQPDVKNLDVIHWKTPYNNPRDEKTTEYYMNELFYGVGEGGLEQITKSLAAKKPRYVAFARSRYATDDSWSPFEVPFWNRRQQLKSTLQKLRIELLQLDYHEFGAFPDFLP